MNLKIHTTLSDTLVLLLIKNKFIIFVMQTTNLKWHGINTSTHVPHIFCFKDILFTDLAMNPDAIQVHTVNNLKWTSHCKTKTGETDGTMGL